MHFSARSTVDPDLYKMDGAVVALLHLISCTEGKREFVRKGDDWEALNRICQNGFIGDPKNKNEPAVFTQKGRRKAQESFRRLFLRLMCIGSARIQQLMALRIFRDAISANLQCLKSSQMNGEHPEEQESTKLLSNSSFPVRHRT